MAFELVPDMLNVDIKAYLARESQVQNVLRVKDREGIINDERE